MKRILAFLLRHDHRHLTSVKRYSSRRIEGSSSLDVSRVTLERVIVLMTSDMSHNVKVQTRCTCFALMCQTCDSRPSTTVVGVCTRHLHNYLSLTLGSMHLSLSLSLEPLFCQIISLTRKRFSTELCLFAHFSRFRTLVQNLYACLCLDECICTYTRCICICSRPRLLSLLKVRC